MEKVSTGLCKIFFLVVLSFFSINSSSAQTSKIIVEQTTVTIYERYHIDFEIAGMNNPDSTVLNQLNLDQYEHLRNANTRVSVLDQTTGKTIVLYAVTEATQNKANRDFGNIKSQSNDKNSTK